jgi:response regulator RpfG family c-di-GMP phosphodiesterase
MRRDTPRVLVVGDQIGARALFTGWLSAGGYRCLTAEDSAAALRVVGRTSPQVVVIDEALRNRDGMWLAQRVCDRLTPTGVVMVAGSRSSERAHLAKEMGISEYLIAPSSSQELVAAVDRAATEAEARAREARRKVTVAVQARQAVLANAVKGVTTATAARDALQAAFVDRVPGLFAHAARVAQVARSIAVALHLPAETVAHIEGAALLHDAGKLSLPEAVLVGDAPIGDAEMDALLDHHTRAAALLAHAPALDGVTTIVESVHECWDGSGYPAGLAGVDIPLGARIVAVADVLDASQSWGVYQDPQSREDAQTALICEAGTRLDPDLVRVCLHWMDRQSCS